MQATLVKYWNQIRKLWRSSRLVCSATTGNKRSATLPYVSHSLAAETVREGVTCTLNLFNHDPTTNAAILKRAFQIIRIHRAGD